MSTPHTPLRHRMLREIGARRVCSGFNYIGLGISVAPDYKDGHAIRAVGALVDAGLAHEAAGFLVPLELTDAGRSLLAEWDAAHPDYADGGN